MKQMPTLHIPLTQYDECDFLEDDDDDDDDAADEKAEEEDAELKQLDPSTTASQSTLNPTRAAQRPVQDERSMDMEEEEEKILVPDSPTQPEYQCKYLWKADAHRPQEPDKILAESSFQTSKNSVRDGRTTRHSGSKMPEGFPANSIGTTQESSLVDIDFAPYNQPENRGSNRSIDSRQVLRNNRPVDTQESTQDISQLTHIPSSLDKQQQHRNRNRNRNRSRDRNRDRNLDRTHRHRQLAVTVDVDAHDGRTDMGLETKNTQAIHAAQTIQAWLIGRVSLTQTINIARERKRCKRENLEAAARCLQVLSYFMLFCYV